MLKGVQASKPLDKLRGAYLSLLINLVPWSQDWGVISWILSGPCPVGAGLDLLTESQSTRYYSHGRMSEISAA
jgi:hypothetical protein